MIVVDEDGAPLDAPLTMEWRGAFSIARVPEDVDDLMAATRGGLEAGRH